MKPSDESIYVNFVAYAVLGLMSHADDLVRRHLDSLRRISNALAFALGSPPRTLHRGILLDPATPFVLDARAFMSWSEDRDVAQWFACPRSVVSEPLAATNPRLVGHLAELATTTPRRILFRHAWTRALGGIHGIAGIARRHPHMSAEHAQQIAWSLSTQREVITEPLDVTPVRAPDLDGDALAELERRLSPPWIVEAEGVRR